MRVAVLGLGIQGKKRLAIAGKDIVASVDPVNPEAQYTSIEQVPLNAFEAALVCTPDHVKLDLLAYLLAHGKHVLVEKPLLAGRESDLTSLQELAKANGVTCYTAYNHRFEPHISRLKSLLDSGALGRVYLARFFYGNGTAGDVKQSAWRDTGLGVLPDLGSHLLDMAIFLFGKDDLGAFEPWSFNCFENRSFDHVFFGSRGRLVLEMEATLLSWRNTFSLDVFGELGTAHVNCLCKWGPSTFTARRRVLPSGKPDQDMITIECADPTWVIEYEHFKRLCQKRATNLDNDIWINQTMSTLAEQIGMGWPA